MTIILTTDQANTVREALSMCIPADPNDLDEALAILDGAQRVEQFEWRHEDMHGDEVGPPTICYTTMGRD
jgi:hypothetical protein